MPIANRLLLEVLEDRLSPATLAPLWPDPQHLTLSFVPDGTSAGSSGSVLAQTLDGAMPTGTWRLELLRAFQTWAVLGNVNIGLVADGGQPLGDPGAVQGDARFGDIRLGARPLGDSVLATGNSFQLGGGTWSGDVLLNSSYPFGLGAPGAYDLFSVALHEAGHVFGLEDNSDPFSVLYGAYCGPRLGPSAQDIADFQGLYGARQADAFEGKQGNDTRQTASPLGAVLAPVSADVTTLDDVDWYKVAIPADVAAGSTVSVQVRTAGISLLVPALTVLDNSLRALGSAAATSPLGGDLSVAIENVSPGGVYYVKVGNATQSVFGIGSYQLSLSARPGTSPAPSAQVDAGSNKSDLFTAATWLTARKNSPTTLDFSYQARIGSSTDMDYYRFHSPAGNATQEMIVRVSASDLNGLAPWAEVFDASGAPVPAEVIGNDRGFFSVRVANALPDATYYVKVSALAPNGSHNVGDYQLGIDFSATATVHSQTFAAGVLTAAAPQQFQTLSVQQAGAFQLVLAADAGGAADVQVQLSIWDQAGHLVFWLGSSAGQPPSSGVAYLAAGTYTVRYLAVARSGVLPPSVSYDLRGWVVSDPIGPDLIGTMPTTTSTTDIYPPVLWYPSEPYQWSDPSYLALDIWPVYVNPFYY